MVSSRVLSRVGKNRLFDEMENINQDFFIQNSPEASFTYDEGLKNRISGNQDNENIIFEVKYTSSIEVKQKKEGNHLESSSNDLTFDKLNALSNEINEDLVCELSKLKIYVLNSVLDTSETNLDVNKLKDKAFKLYSKRIFSMNDVIQFTNISTAEFIDEINARGIPFQYESDFEVLDEDIEDWI